MARRRRRQSAQTLVIFALVLAFFFAGMLALVADLGALFIAYNRVDGAVLLAIQAGASAVDQGSFYTGSLALDPAEAQRRCADSLAASRLPGGCSADARSVTADVRQSVVLPVPVLGLSAPVHVIRTAQPAFGGSSAVTTT